jgi:hypothetical protein
MRNDKLEDFRNQLDALGYSWRCLWEAKIPGDKYCNVSCYNILSAGDKPEVATVIIHDYGERYPEHGGYMLWIEASSNKIEDDVRLITGKGAESAVATSA